MNRGASYRVLRGALTLQLFVLKSCSSPCCRNHGTVGRHACLFSGLYPWLCYLEQLLDSKDKMGTTVKCVVVGTVQISVCPSLRFLPGMICALFFVTAARRSIPMHGSSVMTVNFCIHTADRVNQTGSDDAYTCSIYSIHH